MSPERPTADRAARKPWEAPRLTVHGPIERLTKGTSKYHFGNEGLGGGDGMAETSGAP